MDQTKTAGVNKPLTKVQSSSLLTENGCVTQAVDLDKITWIRCPCLYSKTASLDLSHSVLADKYEQAVKARKRHNLCPCFDTL